MFLIVVGTRRVPFLIVVGTRRCAVLKCLTNW